MLFLHIAANVKLYVDLNHYESWFSNFYQLLFSFSVHSLGFPVVSVAVLLIYQSMVFSPEVTASGGLGL